MPLVTAATSKQKQLSAKQTTGLVVEVITPPEWIIAQPDIVANAITIPVPRRPVGAISRVKVKLNGLEEALLTPPAANIVDDAVNNVTNIKITGFAAFAMVNDIITLDLAYRN